ncbi:MAG: glycosyltransferase family 4 protein [Saprospiraceae bacterium]|nr:glycosyltransferase family 4 protein [Saprospiraceae bacterium]
MIRKKVLIITYYWPPAGGGGVQRWLKFVKYLREFGWEPIVYTAENPDYPIVDTSFLNEIQEDIQVLKHPIWEPYGFFRKLTGKKSKEKMDPGYLSQGKNFGWKEKVAVWIRGNYFIPDARCFWIKPSIKYLQNFLNDNKVDAIVSTGPPHSCHLIGLGLKKKTGIPWIADFRDQWTQIDYFKDLRLTSASENRHKQLEKEVLDTCDRVVTVGKNLAEGLLLITQNEIHVITNGYDETDRSIDKTKPTDDFSIVYIGTINDAQNPLVLWKAIKRLKDEGHELMNDLKIKIVGKAEDGVFTSIKSLGIGNVIEYVGYVPHHEAILHQQQAQILLLLINNTSNNKVIVTGKLFEYLASGRPVFCIGPKDGDAAVILEETNAGRTFEYNDIDGICNQLKAWYTLYKTNNLTSVSKNIEKYERKNLTKRMAALLDEITNL